MAMASHYGGNGDLRRVYKHLLKGFLALPSTLKTNPYLMYLLDDAIEVKRLIKEGYQLSENDKQRLKTRYVDVAFEAPVQLISQALENLFGKDEFIDTTQTTTPVEQLSTLLDALRVAKPQPFSFKPHGPMSGLFPRMWGRAAPCPGVWVPASNALYEAPRRVSV